MSNKWFHPAAVAGCKAVEIETFDKLANDIGAGPEPILNPLAVHRLVQRGLFERDPRCLHVLGIPQHFMAAWANWAAQQPGDPFGVAAARDAHSAMQDEAVSDIEWAARLSDQCPGCGTEKQVPLVVCWDCFTSGPAPLKSFSGTLAEWLISRANTSNEEVK